MVVDDDESARVALANVLAGDGWLVDSAGSAEKARALLDAHAYTLLVIDIDVALDLALTLPGATGLQLVGRLRATPSVPDRPAAIAVSAQDGPGDRSNALDAGFDAFLARPVAPEDLLALVAAITAPPDDPIVTELPTPRV